MIYFLQLFVEYKVKRIVQYDWHQSCNQQASTDGTGFADGQTNQT